MKTSTLVAAALAASVNGAVIDARQKGKVPDGIPSPNRIRAPAPQRITIGPPRASVTFFPNDPDDRVSQCGLDAFIGHTSEALLFCSSILKGGTAVLTSTYTSRETTTTKTTVWTTLYPPTRKPSSTVRPPTSTPKPSTSARPSSTSTPPRPSSTSTPPRPSSTSTPPKPSSTSTPKPPSSTPRPSSTVVTTPSPTPTPGAGCGIVGYVKTTAAYFFDSTGTKNTWAACSAACKADAKCKSFGYGEANCMLFDVPAAENTNYNPMSPYTFYDSTCPVELPVRKRQVNISLGIPGGASGISSACSCLITSGPGATTRTTTVTVTSVRATRTETVTRTVSLLPEDYYERK